MRGGRAVAMRLVGAGLAGTGRPVREGDGTIAAVSVQEDGLLPPCYQSSITQPTHYRPLHFLCSCPRCRYENIIQIRCLYEGISVEQMLDEWETMLPAKMKEWGLNRAEVRFDSCAWDLHTQQASTCVHSSEAGAMYSCSPGVHVIVHHTWFARGHTMHVVHIWCMTSLPVLQQQRQRCTVPLFEQFAHTYANRQTSA